MRGGQVTLFVAIGLVMLLVVGIFFTVMLKGDGDTDVRETASTGVLANYLQSCLDTIVYDELETIGQSGGVLFFDRWPSAIVEGQRIVYGITRNHGGDGQLPGKLPLPQYPDWGVRKGMEDWLYENDNPVRQLPAWQDGYFGDVWLPAPCSRASTNRPGSTFTCRYYEGNPPGTPGPSVQELLEENVRQRVQGCADLRAFRQAVGSDVRSVGEPAVNVTMTYDNIIVRLLYPLELESGTKLEEFTRRYRVRLLPLMQFAIDLAKEETRNVTFNISGDYRDIPSWREGFLVMQRAVRPEQITGQIESPRADVVSVTDSRSVIEGQSFSISFLVEHRLPFLDHIGEEDWQLGCNAFPSRWLAWDPDEGPVTVGQDCAQDGSIVRYIATDADGNEDWQER